MPNFARATPAVFSAATLFLLAVAAPTFAQSPVLPDTALVERIMQADTNGDGEVSRAELIAWRAKQFARLDRNGDGFIDANDVPALMADRFAPRLAQLRASFDADHDGRISRAEFVNGPSPGFDFADANHDGVVTRAEIDAATARIRAARRG